MEYGYGFGTIAAFILAGCAILLILLFALYHYVFRRFMQKERTVRATVCGKRCENPGVAVAENTDASNLHHWRGGDAEYGCFGIVLFLLASMPWRRIAKNGLTDPYLIQFDQGEKRRISLAVSYEVYMNLNQGQEGLLTYKGNRFKRFRSLPTDKGGPVDVVEKPGS